MGRCLPWAKSTDSLGVCEPDSPGRVGIQGWQAASGGGGAQPEEDVPSAWAAAAPRPPPGPPGPARPSSMPHPLAWWQLPVGPVRTFSRGHCSPAALRDLAQCPSVSLQVCARTGRHCISDAASRVVSGVSEPQTNGVVPTRARGSLASASWTPALHTVRDVGGCDSGEGDGRLSGTPSRSAVCRQEALSAALSKSPAVAQFPSDPAPPWQVTVLARDSV